MDASNTGENRPPNKGQFTKGDPRINRKGRPKSFDALRTLAQQIATETQVSKDGTTKLSRVELILRSWSLSPNPQLQRAFIEIAYGKVPDEVRMTGKDGGPITFINVGVDMEKL